MTLQFHGSAISIYGAGSANHGNYHVQLDNTTFPSVNGATTSATFNRTLFSSKITPGFHTVTLTNDQDTYLDVDYVR